MSFGGLYSPTLLTAKWIRHARSNAGGRRILFGTCRAPDVIENLTDNSSGYKAKKTRIFARPLGLKPCLTPVGNSQSIRMPDAFMKTLERDYVRVNPLRGAETVPRLTGDLIEGYGENHHRHGGLKRCAPHEFIKANIKACAYM